MATGIVSLAYEIVLLVFSIGILVLVIQTVNNVEKREDEGRIGGFVVIMAFSVLPIFLVIGFIAQVRTYHFLGKLKVNNISYIEINDKKINKIDLKKITPFFKKRELASHISGRFDGKISLNIALKTGEVKRFIIEYYKDFREKVPVFLLKNDVKFGGDSYAYISDPNSILKKYIK